MSRLSSAPTNLAVYTADPTTPTPRAGDTYFNSVFNMLRRFDGSLWQFVPSLSRTDSEWGRATLPNSSASNRFRSALAHCNTAPCDVFILGDSLLEGEGATDSTLRAVAHLINQWRGRFQSFAPGGKGWNPPYFASPSIDHDKIVGGTGGSAWVGFGLGGRGFGIQGTQTLSYNVFGTSADVCYALGPAGGAGSTLGILLDGVQVFAPVTYNATVFPMQVQRVTFPTRGWHTIKVQANAGGTVYEGSMVYDGDENAGIRLWDASHYGWKSGDYAVNLTNNGVLPAGWNQTSLTRQMNVIQPALVVLELGANDYYQGIASATFRANLNILIAAVRAGCTIPPLIMMLIPGTPTNATPAEPWYKYTGAMYGIVESDSTMDIMDMTLRMVSQPNDVNGLFAVSDGDHLSNKGHKMYATLLDERLTESMASDVVASPYPTVENTFSANGTFTAQTGTSVWQVRRACVWDSGDLNLTTTGSSATTLDVKKNGVTIYTTSANRPSVGSGVGSQVSTTPDIVQFVSGDKITVDIVSAGTGAAGLTYTLRLRPV